MAVGAMPAVTVVWSSLYRHRHLWQFVIIIWRENDGP
jgi:hypothetical protein